MTMFKLFLHDYQQLRTEAAAAPRASEAARLRHKLWRKEIGLAVVTLGAMVMFLDATRVLAGLTG